MMLEEMELALARFDAMINFLKKRVDEESARISALWNNPEVS
jgi:hypothetical protein